MAYTYRNLCTDALIACGAVDPSETPESSEILYALRECNSWMASLLQRADIPYKQITITGYADGNGKLIIGPNVVEDANHVKQSIGRIHSVIDVNNYTNLTELAYQDFVIQNRFGSSTMTFYAWQQGDIDEKEILTYPGANLNVVADLGHTEKNLDTVFDLPSAYQGMLVYGLAAIVAPSFNAPEAKVQACLSTFQSRKSSIESANFRLSPLNSNKAGNYSFENGYM